VTFIDLLDILDSDEQLIVTVTNEWGYEVYEGTVDHFREEELLTTLRVCRIFTHIIDDHEHFDARYNRVALTTEIDVTLYDDEHKIIDLEDDEY
jgi:hypothetical protein